MSSVELQPPSSSTAVEHQTSTSVSGEQLHEHNNDLKKSAQFNDTTSVSSATGGHNKDTAANNTAADADDIDLHSASSENFLKQDSAGLIGCLERIPLVVKLLCITIFASAIIMVFAIWLIVSESLSLAAVTAERKFTKSYGVAAAIITSLERERGATSSYYLQPTNSSVVIELRSAQSSTDAAIKSFTTTTEWKATYLKTQLPQYFASLNSQRPASTTNGTSASSDVILASFEWQTNFIEAVMNLISIEAQATANTDVVLINSFYLRVRKLLIIICFLCTKLTCCLLKGC